MPDPSTGILIPQTIVGIRAGPQPVPQKCGTCHYSWVDAEGDLNCRRFPPTAFMVLTRGKPYVNTAHPIVLAEHWCGEWRVKITPTTG